jgi:hypothetical protein
MAVGIGIGGVFLWRHYYVLPDPFTDILGPPPSMAQYFTYPRYQLYLHPEYRRDHFLLDTQTGECWNIQESSDNEPILVPVKRKD